MDLKLQNKNGFTLVEMIVVTAIVSVLALLVALLLSRGLIAYRYNQQAIRMQDTAAKAMRDFEAKTRGAEQVITAEANELIFYAYIAGDVRPAPSKIRYYFDSGDLKRGIISPFGIGPTYSYPEDTEIIATEATGLLSDQIFTYYSDQDYNYNDDSVTQLPFPVDLTLIKVVRISLQIDYDINKPPVAANESTLVNLRNLKRNL